MVPDPFVGLRVESATHTPLPTEKTAGLYHRGETRTNRARQPAACPTLGQMDPTRGRASTGMNSLSSANCAIICRVRPIWGPCISDRLADGQGTEPLAVGLPDLDLLLDIGL